MTSDRIGQAITILGSIALVGSALIARRVRLRANGGKMALAWAAILAALVAAGLWIDRHR